MVGGWWGVDWLAFRRHWPQIGPGDWQWTSHSPTGSGPEGSSPNELRFGSLVSLPPLISSYPTRGCIRAVAARAFRTERTAARWPILLKVRADRAAWGSA